MKPWYFAVLAGDHALDKVGTRLEEHGMVALLQLVRIGMRDGNRSDTAKLWEYPGRAGEVTLVT